MLQWACHQYVNIKYVNELARATTDSSNESRQLRVGVLSVTQYTENSTNIEQEAKLWLG